MFATLGSAFDFSMLLPCNHHRNYVYYVYSQVTGLTSEYLSRFMRKPKTWTDVIICKNDGRYELAGKNLDLWHVYSACVLPRLVTFTFFKGF